MNPGDLLRQRGLDASYAESSIPMDVILTLITCGIYNLFWNHRQMAVFNALLEEDRFQFWTWFFLTIITCGIYHIYYEYRMAEAMKQLQRKFDRPVNDNLSMLALILSIFGFPIVVDAIFQDELNSIVSRDTRTP